MSAKPSKAGDLLAEVFRRGGMKRGLRRAEAVLLWPQVVGSEVARFTEARSLQDGVLIIEVPDSETAMHLTLQRSRFLDVYHGKFGVRDVRELRFVPGRRPQPTPEEPAAAPTKVDPRALAKLARELGELNLPDDLAKPAMQAARAMLAYRARREAEGWTPCPTCGALVPEPGPCDTCRRYAEEPKVISASRALAVDPDQATPLLSEDERQVAVALAKSYLREKMQELLPQVLADPAFKAHLESAARCYLAHELQKPLQEVSEHDLERLEPRIARALGRWG